MNRADSASRIQRAHAPRTLIADLTRRLTPRDTQLLDAVWEHRVLTTEQLAAIFFPSIHRARHRLLQLFQLAALERFRPWTPIGSSSWHWVLGPAGARHLAAQRGVTLRDLRYRPDSAMSIALSSKLSHQVGVNEFFARLHAHACRRSDGTAVTEWWHERRCASLWGDLARPDAFGRWQEVGEDGQPASVDFFLEHDTGTETLARVVGKLESYTALAEATGITTPVLFWLPSTTREAHLRQLLATSVVPVATAVHTPAADADGPAGAVWLPARSTGPRMRLAALRDAWPARPAGADGPGSRCA